MDFNPVGGGVFLGGFGSGILKLKVRADDPLPEYSARKALLASVDADGRERWQSQFDLSTLEYGASATQVVSTDLGPVVLADHALKRGEDYADTLLRAFDWSGQPRWSVWIDEPAKLNDFAAGRLGQSGRTTQVPWHSAIRFSTWRSTESAV